MFLHTDAFLSRLTFNLYQMRQLWSGDQQKRFAEASRKFQGEHLNLLILKLC